MNKLLKNWAGLSYHRTDQFVDWHERNPLEKMNKLRAAYDRIAAAGLQDDIELLLDAAYDMGKIDEYDAHAKDL